MTWRDRLMPASFRGVAFHLDDIGHSTGRQAVSHVFPGSDAPYTEDMGLKPLDFKVSAYCVGPEYLTQLDRLKQALLTPGPATLVHPTMGEIRVQVGDVSVTYDSAVGAYEGLEITFIQHGANPLPDAMPDTPGLAASTATTAQAAIASQFATNYSLEGVQNFVAEDAVTCLGDIPTALTHLADTGTGVMLASFARKLGTLVASATNVASEVLSIVKALGSQRNATTALDTLSQYGDGWLPVPLLTPARIRQQTNRVAMITLVKGLALAERVRVMSQTNWPSYDEAIAQRDGLVQAINRQLATAPDAVYTALVLARKAMVDDVTARAATLARLQEVTLYQPIPALVLAWQLYGDTGRADDLVARNRVRHPSFMPSTLPLEVLSV